MQWFQIHGHTFWADPSWCHIMFCASGEGCKLVRSTRSNLSSSQTVNKSTIAVQILAEKYRHTWLNHSEIWSHSGCTPASEGTLSYHHYSPSTYKSMNYSQRVPYLYTEYSHLCILSDSIPGKIDLFSYTEWSHYYMTYAHTDWQVLKNPQTINC